MAVAEYMMHRIEGGTRRAVPEFIGDRGHWQSPIDKSFIGWIDDARDYYVPDTVTTLTKAEFVTRQLTIHNTEGHAFMTGVEPDETPVELSNTEVTTTAETWYDAFVTKNS
tara:strand:+ start:592 stop:924 length:333 start_codon:yes stop_codon:yes gene_type:complete